MRIKSAGFWRKTRFAFNIIYYIDFLGKTLLWWHSLPWAYTLANLLQSEKALHVTCKLWTNTPPWWGNNASTCGAMGEREFGVSLKQQRFKLCASFAICRIYTTVMPWLEGKGWQVCRQPYHLASSRAPDTNILWEFQWAIYDKLDAPKRWPPKKATSIHCKGPLLAHLVRQWTKEEEIISFTVWPQCMACVPVSWKTIRKKVPYEI